mgnify:CR=1 FL=1
MKLRRIFSGIDPDLAAALVAHFLRYFMAALVATFIPFFIMAITAAMHGYPQ